MSQALQCAGFVDNELLFIMVEARSPRNPIQARLYLHFFFSVRFCSILRSRHKYALSGYLLFAGYHRSHKIVKQTNVDSAHHLFHFHHDFDSSMIFRIARSFFSCFVTISTSLSFVSSSVPTLPTLDSNVRWEKC